MMWLLNKYMLGGLAILALVAGAVAFVHHHDSAIATKAYAAGYDARVAEDTKATAAAQAETSRRATASAQATDTMHAELAADQPKLEEAAHARAEEVRIIYRDHPVPVTCMRPAGVLQRLDAARSAANAAARGAPG